MDDFKLSLAPRNDTPTLCSNATLWEMDDIEASEPLEMLQTAPTGTIGRDSDRSLLNDESTGSFANNFALPLRQIRSAASANAPPKLVDSRLQWPFAPAQASVMQAHSIDFNRARSEAGGYAADFYTSPRTSSHQGPAPAYKDCNTPLGVTPAAVGSKPSEMSFMHCYPKGNAIVRYRKDNGQIESIAGIAIDAFEQNCPVLAAAFETRNAGPQLYLEILSETTALPFLRYLYTGSYALSCLSDGLYGDVPTSLLLHCQMYHLAAIYDIPVLMKQANVNIIRQCEFGCSSPDPPIHLSAAIKYSYKHLSSHSTVLNTIVSYCVACFLRHRLAKDEEFKQIAFELKPFHQALCQESMNRKFENETASAIIQMPFKRDAPEFYLSREDLMPSRMRDVVHHFHGSDGFDHSSDARKVSQNTAKEVKGTEREQPASSMRGLSALKFFRQSNEHAKTSVDALKPPEPPGLSDSPSNALLSDTDRFITRLQVPHRTSDQTELQPSISECTNSGLDLDLLGPTDDNRTVTADTETVPDLDYELISGPPSVESLCSDSDGESHVVDPIQPITSANTLPIRVRSKCGSAGSFEWSGSCDNAPESSDSEWSLI